MSVFVNDGGVEKEAKMIYVNDGGVDKLVAGGGQDFDRGEVWGAVLLGTGILRAMAEGNGVIVAVGDGGRIVSSSEGVVWQDRVSGTSNNLNDVAWGNGVFVAVGHGGTILTSPNGENWTSRTSGTTRNFFGVAFGLGMFAASGPINNIFTSPTGASWTPRPTGASFANTKIGFGNGMFLVKRNANNSLLRSFNGVDWSQITASGMPQYDSPISYSDEISLWLTSHAGTSSNWGIYSSVDGDAWTKLTSGREAAVRYRDGIGVAVGGFGGTIALSDNGSNWSSAYSSGNIAVSFYDVLITDELILACGSSGTIIANLKAMWR